jgi:transposase
VRVCGADLTSIDGINIISAMNISGGKRVKGPNRRVKNRVADVLRMGAVSLLNSHSCLGARYRQLRRHAKIPAAAVKAMARYLAVLVYRLLTKGQAWVDRGAAVFEQKRKQRAIAALHTKASAEGFRLVPFAEASQT